MKQGTSFFDAWGGIAGIQHGLPFLIDLFSLEDPERLQALQDAFAPMPADLIGMHHKGRLSVGADADFFLAEPSAELREVRAEDLLYRHPVSAYLGFEMELAMRGTWLSGVEVVRAGRVVGAPSGRFISGQAFAR